MTGLRLVADIGGTNARFAFADAGGHIERTQSYPAADFPAFMDALHAYLAAAGRPQDLDGCAVAAAGPVDGDRIKLTNNDWSIDRAEVSAALGGTPVALVNDLEAVAAALPPLTRSELDSIGGAACKRPERRTMLAVNIGTGFGAASAVRRDGKWWTCPGEAGHMTLGHTAAGRDDPWPDDGSVETLLSGKGVDDIYTQLARDGGTAKRPDDASDVFALAASDPAASRTVELFTAEFGRVAGDLALATAAWGGVYLYGSVALGWTAVGDTGKFRAAFTRKGAMTARMQRIPVAVIRHENASLFGLARMTIPALDP
jgi:glucokinase